MPFTFTGTLAGFSTVERTGSPLFSLSLTGAGTLAGLFLVDAPSTQLEFDRIIYTFAANPEPVPEPATMILLGSGLAGVLVRHHRRRASKRLAIAPDAFTAGARPA